MSNYAELKNLLSEKLSTSNFTLDDSEQSFNVYPTLHVNLFHGDMVSVEVAKSVYGNVKYNNQIVLHVKVLLNACQNLSDNLSAHVSICQTDCDVKPFNLSVIGMCDVHEGDHELLHFADIPTLLEGIKNFQFES